MSSVSDEAKESKDSGASYRWIVLGGIWLAYFSFGLVQGGIPPLVGPVSNELDLSQSAMGSVLGAWPLIYIFVAIPAGAIIDRFGLRKSLAVGVVLIALSGLLRAVAVDYPTLFLAVAVFGVGGPFISIGAPKLVATWFSQSNRGIAMGIYMTAPAVGHILALATANSIFMPLYSGNWRFTLITFAGFALVTALVWWFLARHADDRNSSGEPSKSLITSMKVFPELLRIRVVQIALLMSVGSFLFSHGFNNWLPEILRERGMTAASAGYLATVPILVGIGATLLIPFLAKPNIRVPLLAVIFALAGVSALVIGNASGLWLMIGLILEGAASRGILPIIMLILMDARQLGPNRMGAVGGLYFTAGEVGGVLGPLMLGIVADVTGGFWSGTLILACLCFVLAVLTLTLTLALRR